MRGACHIDARDSELKGTSGRTTSDVKVGGACCWRSITDFDRHGDVDTMAADQRRDAVRHASTLSIVTARYCVNMKRVATGGMNSSSCICRALLPETCIVR